MIDFDKLSDGDDKLAISNAIKIIEYMHKTYKRSDLNSLSINNCYGEFDYKNYHYTWIVSPTYGLMMRVGGLNLIGSADSGYDLEQFTCRHDKLLFRIGFSEHYGAFVDCWKNIRQSIYNRHTDISERKTFEP